MSVLSFTSLRTFIAIACDLFAALDQNIRHLGSAAQPIAVRQTAAEL